MTDDLQASLGLSPGSVLSGRYRIDRTIGEGGMGWVVAATHLTLGTSVAIKFLLPGALGNAEALARFVREARAMARIQSEHVVRVSDVATLDNGVPFIVMEQLIGRDLASLLEHIGPLPLRDVCDYVLQACEALAEAHALGIVHRDLKPANLFLVKRADGSPCIKVLDFGVAKAAVVDDTAGLTLTRSAAIVGSPLYMSPEQLQSAKHVDARSDIWSLGVVMYELMSGRVPFPATTLPQLCALMLQTAPPAVRDLRPDTPEQLEAVVFRCLEKPPELRFASLAELAYALVPFASPTGRASAQRIARVLSTADEPMVAADVPVPAVAAVTNASRLHYRSGWIVGLVAAALGVVAIVFSATSERRATPVAEVRPPRQPYAPPSPVAEPSLPASTAASPVVASAPLATGSATIATRVRSDVSSRSARPSSPQPATLVTAPMASTVATDSTPAAVPGTKDLYQDRE